MERRQFLSSSVYLLAPFASPVPIFSIETRAAKTFFHINSAAPFWTQIANRKTLLSILDGKVTEALGFKSPSIDITISGENLRHLITFRKLADRLSLAGVPYRLNLLTEQEFWNNWRSYDFTLLDWETSSRAGVDINRLVSTPESPLSLENAGRLLSGPGRVRENPYLALETKGLFS